MNWEQAWKERMDKRKVSKWKGFYKEYGDLFADIGFLTLCYALGYLLVDLIIEVMDYMTFYGGWRIVREFFFNLMK